MVIHIEGLVQDCSISSALAMDLLQSCIEPSICSFKKNCISVTLCYSIGNSCRDNWVNNWVNSFLLASLSHLVGVNKPMLLSMWKTSPWHEYPFQMECMFHVINKFQFRWIVCPTPFDPLCSHLFINDVSSLPKLFILYFSCNISQMHILWP